MRESGLFQVKVELHVVAEKFLEPVDVLGVGGCFDGTEGHSYAAALEYAPFLLPSFFDTVDLIFQYFIHAHIPLFLFLGIPGDLLLNVLALHDPDYVLIQLLLVHLCFLRTAELLDVVNQILDLGLEVVAYCLLLCVEVVHTVTIAAQEYSHCFLVALLLVLFFGLEQDLKEARI